MKSSDYYKLKAVTEGLDNSIFALLKDNRYGTNISTIKKMLPYTKKTIKDCLSKLLINKQIVERKIGTSKVYYAD